MLQDRPRQVIKDLLAQSRIKLVYDRITHTRYTRFYFFLSGFTCLLLCALQGVILADNTKGVDILTKVVDEAEPAPHITILKNGRLHVCERIPKGEDDECIVLWLNDGTSLPRAVARRRRRSAKFRRQALPGPEEAEESETSDSEEDGGVSSDDDGEEGSDESEAAGETESDDEEEEGEGNVETITTTTVIGGVTSTITTTATSTSPASTVTTTSTSVTISSTGSPSETMTVSFPTPTPGPSPSTDGGDTRTRGNGINLSQSPSSPHSMQCIYALSWLEEVLHDSQREDAATLLFQIWVFGIGLVAILNESIPHLGAAIFSHILAAAWSATRIQSAKSLASFYRENIVSKTCANVDLLGTWWELRLAHTIPVAVFNILVVIGLGFVSWKLLRVYASSTFSRVGPTLAVQRVYRLVLVFSAGLQLAGFFTAVSTGLWIAKAGHGSYRTLSAHGNLYIAAFVAILIAEIPWLYLGWVCVRKECKKRFVAFLILSAFLIGVSSAMFSSNLYRTIFSSWRLFAVITVTSFILLVLTAVFGLICYLHFGRGLAHYLQVQDALEGSGFTPEYFPRNANDSEKDGDSGFLTPNFNPTRGQDPYTGFYSAETKQKSEKDLEWTLPSRPASSTAYLSANTAPAVPRKFQLQDPPAARTNNANIKSVWSADTADVDINLAGPSVLSTPDIIANMPLPPASTLQPQSRYQQRVPSQRIPSGVSSLVAFQGLAALPPTTPLAEQGERAERRVSSASSTGSVRSLKESPFPTAPVRSLTAGSQARGESRLVDSYYAASNPFEDRHASVMSEGTVMLEAPSKGQLFITNGLPTPSIRRV